jgi:biopolymer transport protein ExbD
MVVYTADHRLSINNSDVSINELQSRLTDIFSTRKEKTLFINGAETLRYGDIIAVIDAAKGAGVTKVGIVTVGMQRAAGVATN